MQYLPHAALFGTRASTLTPYTSPKSARAKANGSLFDIFKSGDAQIKVNRFLWNASLDVLDFLPIQTADPFTGVIATGYGTPPGGGAGLQGDHPDQRSCA